MMRLVITSLALMVIFAGCSAPKSEVTVVDFRNAKGAYILAYSTIPSIRNSMEDQLVADLEQRGFVAFPSYPDIPDVKSSNRETVLGAANAKKAMLIVVLEQVEAGKQSAVRNPDRISHEHPSLQDFYSHNRPEVPDHEPGDDVFIEVNGFLIQGDYAKLIWSGTTWTYEADGEGGAIPGISTRVADEMVTARDKYLRRY